jgi:mono/diheme cytochrome c family protein
MRLPVVTTMLLAAAVVAVALTGCAAKSQPAETTISPATTGGASSGASAAPTDPVAIGQQIFSNGQAADGTQIATTSGPGGPCARCHGTDARGAVGPDIRWSVLSGAAQPAGTAPRFPISDQAAFTAAVTTGVVNGNQLRPMMSHYQLTAEQAAALVAYLKTL